MNRYPSFSDKIRDMAPALFQDRKFGTPNSAKNRSLVPRLRRNTRSEIRTCKFSGTKLRNLTKAGYQTAKLGTIRCQTPQVGRKKGDTRYQTSVPDVALVVFGHQTPGPTDGRSHATLPSSHLMQRQLPRVAVTTSCGSSRRRLRRGAGRCCRRRSCTGPRRRAPCDPSCRTRGRRGS